MSKDCEWENERFWIEVELKGLYPPEKITRIEGAKELIKNKDFISKKVLDNGCGIGWFGKMLQEKGAKVIGTDISNTLLEEASKYILTKKTSSYELPFDDEVFDCVISFMVIHVLDNPVQALKEAWRVLKPNGELYVAIVHPMAEKWDEKTGLCHFNPESYDNTEERTWIFNLTNGGQFIKHYINRPVSFYESEFNKLFEIKRKLEPKFPEELRENGKYASREYLFYELIKK